MTVDAQYWLPEWWDWFERWGECFTCLKYMHTPCASCEVPPGLLALAQLVGGGTEIVAGNHRGNATIRSRKQAEAAARVPSAEATTQQWQGQRQSVQQEQIDVDVAVSDRQSEAITRTLNRRDNRG